MIPSNTEVELSPLDQIRQAEAEVTRRVAAARKKAERAQSRTRQRVIQMKNIAREDGLLKGRLRYQEIIKKSEEEAEALIIDAHQKDEELRRRGLLLMESAVRFIVSLVIGSELEAEDQ